MLQFISCFLSCCISLGLVESLLLIRSLKFQELLRD